MGLIIGVVNLGVSNTCFHGSNKNAQKDMNEFYASSQIS